MASKPHGKPHGGKPPPKHPASDHLRAAADAMDQLHQQMAGMQQQQQQQPQGPVALPGQPPGGVSPLGGLAK